VTLPTIGINSRQSGCKMVNETASLCGWGRDRPRKNEDRQEVEGPSNNSIEQGLVCPCETIKKIMAHDENSARKVLSTVVVGRL
jgi:hypothetical protein